MRDRDKKYPRYSTPTDIATVATEKANYVQPATRRFEPLKVKPHPWQDRIDAYRALPSALKPM